MSENRILEITKMMTDRSNLEKDFNEATEMVFNMFKNKYLGKLQNEFSKKISHHKEHPSKEVQLIKSLKSFMPEEKHGDIDKLIDTFVLFDALSQIKAESPTPVHKSARTKAAAKSPPKNTFKPKASAFDDETGNDSSIHQDGIYEIDKECMSKRNLMFGKNPYAGLFLLMAFNGYNKQY